MAAQPPAAGCTLWAHPASERRSARRQLRLAQARDLAGHGRSACDVRYPAAHARSHKQSWMFDWPQVLKKIYPPLRGPDFCHTDIVSCIIITETAKIITGG
jgi:hypothetical protein